jgi:predicted lipid-binding transport protein (Tim44 family)
MDELIARVTAALGVDANLAKVAIGHVLVFLQKEFPDGPVAELIGKLPGSQDAIDAAAADQGGNGGLLGGLMGGAGGLMGLAGKLNSAGLDMGQIQTLAREILAHAEGLIGKENVQKIASAIPGLSQFL